jgi:hypothetical protein
MTEKIFYKKCQEYVRKKVLNILEKMCLIIVRKCFEKVFKNVRKNHVRGINTYIRQTNFGPLCIKQGKSLFLKNSAVARQG